MWHDNSGHAAGWFLDKVELQDKKDLYLVREFFWTKLRTLLLRQFECNRWLAHDEDDGQLVREMPATGKRLKKPLKCKKTFISTFSIISFLYSDPIHH